MTKEGRSSFPKMNWRKVSKSPHHQPTSMQARLARIMLCFAGKNQTPVGRSL
ncbi:hypothetical protein FKM82_014117 [Ascaphus truei]